MIHSQNRVAHGNKNEQITISCNSIDISHEVSDERKKELNTRYDPNYVKFKTRLLAIAPDLDVHYIVVVTLWSSLNCALTLYPFSIYVLHFNKHSCPLNHPTVTMKKELDGVRISANLPINQSALHQLSPAKGQGGRIAMHDCLEVLLPIHPVTDTVRNSSVICLGREWFFQTQRDNCTNTHIFKSFENHCAVLVFR